MNHNEKDQYIETKQPDFDSTSSMSVEQQPKTETTAPKSTEIQLAPEQLHAKSLILDWYKSSPNQEFKLGGYAGTGKTTLQKAVKAEFENNLNIRVAVVAFTGKAVNVLQRKGISAATIHSTIYDCHQDKDGWHFSKKTLLESRPKLIICDEASMVSTDLYNDLKSFGIKILWVGDPGQLEPVGDNPNLMREPNFTLSQIHRQAAQSPIITLANNVRNGVGACLTHQRYGANFEVIVQPKRISPELILKYDQLICAKNQTRQNFNTSVRDFQGKPKTTVVEGDKIIVLRNNLSFGVFNGQIFFVKKITSETSECWRCECTDELDNDTSLDIWKRPFQTRLKKDEHIPRRYVYCDFAYAITCHKSQGSEWDNIAVWDEWMPPQVWDMKRWRYTAITRAAKQLTYLV